MKLFAKQQSMIILPGETLRDIMRDRKISVGNLSKLSGISKRHLKSILKGKEPITNISAAGVGRALDIDPSFWRNLQRNFDEETLMHDPK